MEKITIQERGESTNEVTIWKQKKNEKRLYE